jgi:CheY-like chemotaxis protein
VNVLLVEDEADVRELIVEAFVAQGVEVQAAETDERAYEILETGAPSFSALVADINLGPGTTGFDVARRARQLNPNLKVVYITGHAAHLDRFGVDGAVMFPKPFNPTELAQQVIALVAS